MKITRFEDMEAWQVARKMCQGVWRVISTGAFARQFALKDQIDRAAGSAMDNVAEGFDGGSNAEFVRFLGYAQRSCSEVKSQLYRARDRNLITTDEFQELFDLAAECHGKTGGLIHYLKKNREK
jgi:four helix bundle protein